MVRGAARLAGAVLLTAGALAGCTLITDSFLTNDFSGDPFPTQVDSSGGALRVGMQPLDGSAPHEAVLDLLSPFTLLDPGTTADPSLTTVDLMLLGKNVDSTLTLPRARFPQAQLISLHPCAIPAGANPKDLPPCTVGTPDDPKPFDAVVGADVLAGDAIRLRLASDEIFVLADISGSDRGRTLSCEAVFNSPYRGGGTLVISGTELPFGNRRITLSACLGQADDLGSKTPPAPQGADALFVVSTGIGISILDESAYRRYQIAIPGAPDVDALPPGAVYLPSGLITGRLGAINQMALVGASISNGLSPCRQIYAHHMLADGPVAQNPSMDCAMVAGAGGCPCKDGSSFCAVPAVVELTPQNHIPVLPVLIVPDTEPTLQALRTELRPDQPEVDGLLGTDALRSAEIDVDYPHDRLIARCIQPHCLVRPQLTQASDRCQINLCIYGPDDKVGCPEPPPP